MNYILILLVIFIIGFSCAFLIDKLLRFIYNKFYIYKNKDKYQRMLVKIMCNNKLSIYEKTDNIFKIVELKLKDMKIKERKDKLNKLNSK
jgi:hypothetical protein